MTLQLLHGLTLFLTAALLIRLWREGLHTRYKAFVAALAFELVTGVLIYLTPPRRNLRAELFFVSTAIGWVFRFLVLRELCLLVFNDHPGIKAADGIGIRVSLALAIVNPWRSWRWRGIAKWSIQFWKHSSSFTNRRPSS